MARQHAGMAIISEEHKEVVNIRTAGAASKCSDGNAIRIHIRPNSLKPTFDTPLLVVYNNIQQSIHGAVDCASFYIPVRLV